MTVAYLQHEPTDAEQIVQTLSNHFQIVKKTCLQSLAQENEKGLGTLDLLIAKCKRKRIDGVDLLHSMSVANGNQSQRCPDTFKSILIFPFIYSFLFVIRSFK